MDLKNGNDVIVLIANISGGNVTVINFGTSITNNTPAGYNIAVPGTSPITTALVNDCGHMYGYIACKRITNNDIDFGNAVTSTPVQISDFTFSTQYAYRKINMINEAGNWILQCNTYGESCFMHFILVPMREILRPSIKTKEPLVPLDPVFGHMQLRKMKVKLAVLPVITIPANFPGLNTLK
ncbi:MAG: hypothetical protein IPP46_13825 [Bacteroidetes bacterium]|nr:hypothetical protein [Bacteroidota bacterium]